MNETRPIDWDWHLYTRFTRKWWDDRWVWDRWKVYGGSLVGLYAPNPIEAHPFALWADCGTIRERPGDIPDEEDGGTRVPEARNAHSAEENHETPGRRYGSRGRESLS